MRNIIGKKSNQSNNTFGIDNNIVTESVDIANGFNDIFVSIVPQLAHKISCMVNPKSYIVSIVFPEISCDEVKYIIQSQKKSSTGWDEIPTSVAKKCVELFITIFTFQLNTSSRDGVFPNGLKLARVVPILKVGDPTLVNNYRLISVLS